MGGLAASTPKEMSSNTSPDAPALPWQDAPARRGQAARKGDQYDLTHGTIKEPATYYLANSVITLEPGAAGVIARVDRRRETEFAGPLPEETIAAIQAVAEGCP